MTQVNTEPLKWTETHNKALQPTVLPPLRCGKTAAEFERWVSHP